MDILKMLESEHKLALSRLELLITMFADIRRGQYQVDKLSEVTEFFAHYLPLHFRIEEEALFPVLGRIIGIDRGPIPKTIAEHRELQPQIARFLELARNFDPNDEEMVESLEVISKALVEKVYVHARWEEVILLATAREYLSPEQLREAEERARAVR